MNRLPASIFDANEMGNDEFSWSGLTDTSEDIYSFVSYAKVRA